MKIIKRFSQKFDDKGIVIIIQARIDSRRFPRKVLQNIEGKPMLWHIINRVKEMNLGIVIATTKRKIDNPIVAIAKESSIRCFRGSVNDVLDRYYKAALKFGAKIIVRITADSPLIDPNISSKVVDKFLTGNFDYVSTDNNSFPKGLDTECFSFKVLKEAWQKAKLKSEREHVTPYIWKNPDRFRIGLIYNRNNSGKPLRLIVDYKDDLVLIRAIYSKLHKENKIFKMNEIIDVIKKDPRLIEINSNHDPNEGYEFSLKND